MSEELARDGTMTGDAPARRVLPILAAASVIGLVLAATTALWLHYGTAVFFEMIRTGLAACFG